MTVRRNVSVSKELNRLLGYVNASQLIENVCMDVFRTAAGDIEVLSQHMSLGEVSHVVNHLGVVAEALAPELVGGAVRKYVPATEQVSAHRLAQISDLLNGEKAAKSIMRLVHLYHGAGLRNWSWATNS